MKAPWTPEQNAALVHLWARGLSAAQIADELGGDINAEAVRSRAYRIRQTPGSENLLPSRLPTPRRARTAPVCESLDAGPVDPVALVDLEHHHCRYPLGGRGPEALFCGSRKAPGRTSYCGTHRALCEPGRAA